jgi:hypothetical protein
MGLTVVGAGLGRTGTHSLKVALERLLGGTCHHMEEVFAHPEEIAVWGAALEGEHPDWSTFLAGYRACVDWPAAAFWAELSTAFPDALVLLSTRSSAEAWWRSADASIIEAARRGRPGAHPDSVGARQMDMWRLLLRSRFGADWGNGDVMVAAYERHNAEVRDAIPPNRLIEYQPGDGWEPICERLGVAVPDEEFPHSNTLEDFRARWLD